MKGNLQDKVKNLPSNSGVYLFKSEDGTVIYVGKAKNLHDRVSSYMLADVDKKVELIVKNAIDVDFIVTDSAHEALVLENILIKQHQPKYNIKLKDDKNYTYVVVTKEPYPRLLKTRNPHDDKRLKDAHLFGPSTKSGHWHSNIRTLRQFFPVRVCKLDLPEERSRPCLDFHIGLCTAPCDSEISKDNYNKIVSELVLLLSGKYGKLESILTKRMEEASAALRFEEAARYRESIKQLRNIVESQRVVSNEIVDRDIFAVEIIENMACVEFLKVRSGRLILTLHMFADSDVDSSEADFLGIMMQNYYSSCEDSNLPAEILVSTHPTAEKDLLNFINEARTFKKKIKIIQPKRGDKIKLVEMAQTNAKHHLAEHIRKEKIAIGKNAVIELQDELKLKKAPILIEGYDIANIQGKSAVGSQVCFQDGRPFKKGYRIYKIRTKDTPDDYEMMREVLTRRLTHIDDENFAPIPDLILIDGGKGQLGVATEVFKDTGVEIISIAKEEELIFKPGESKPYRLDENGFALRLLKQIRDESHRFAGKHFRIRHKKESA